MQVSSRGYKWQWRKSFKSIRKDWEEFCRSRQNGPIAFETDEKIGNKKGKTFCAAGHKKTMNSREDHVKVAARVLKVAFNSIKKKKLQNEK